MGEIVGAILFLFVLSLILDQVVVRNLVDDRSTSLSISVVAVVPLYIFLILFFETGAGTGPTLLAGLLGAIPAWLLRRWAAPRDEHGELR